MSAPSLRDVRLAGFGSRYRVSARAAPGVCVYCGALARGVDHVPPLAVVAFYPAFLPHIEYAACWDCNRRIAVMPDACLLARAQVLLHSIQTNEGEGGSMDDYAKGRFIAIFDRVLEVLPEACECCVCAAWRDRRQWSLEGR